MTCDFYTVWKLDLQGSYVFEQEHPFLLVSIVEGKGKICDRKVKKGDHLILPFGFGEVRLEGDMVTILSTPNCAN